MALEVVAVLEVEVAEGEREVEEGVEEDKEEACCVYIGFLHAVRAISRAVERKTERRGYPSNLNYEIHAMLHASPSGSLSPQPRALVCSYLQFFFSMLVSSIYRSECTIYLVMSRRLS